MYRMERNNRAAEIAAISNVRITREFWSTYRKLSLRPPSICPLLIDSWEDFYLSHYSSELIDIPRNRFRSIHSSQDLAISFEEIHKTLSQLSNNKAPGPNGLANGFYKSLPPPGISAITTFFDRVLETGIVLECWGMVKTIVIHKKGDKLDHNNYRNIALFNCISKIYAQIIANRMQNWCENQKLFPEYQCGFRRNRGYSDNLFNLLSATQIALSQPGRYIFAIFVDFKQAFDSVEHQMLWDRMRELGLGSRALDTAIDLYEKLNMFYEINGVKSKKNENHQGHTARRIFKSTTICLIHQWLGETPPRGGAYRG